MKLHIGKEIERRYKESGIKLSEFARRLNTSPRNVYTIFDRSEIKTDMLTKIGQVLGFNFFSLYISPDSEVFSEPRLPYPPGKGQQETISVVVVLDGQESSLNQWIKRLTVINKSLG
ncbi:MAG: hypothetical protein ACOYXT_09245 [Bacteroidota bacterium]